MAIILQHIDHIVVGAPVDPPFRSDAASLKTSNSIALSAIKKKNPTYFALKNR